MAAERDTAGGKLVLEREVFLDMKPLKSIVQGHLRCSFKLSNSLLWLAGLCGRTVYLDPQDRYSMALRDCQDLCLVKMPHMAQGEL